MKTERFNELRWKADISGLNKDEQKELNDIKIICSGCGKTLYEKENWIYRVYNGHFCSTCIENM